MGRNQILIADSMKENRDTLKHIFSEQYRILEAVNLDEAITTIESAKDKLAVIFLEFVTPFENSLKVLKYMSEKKYTTSIPVIIITDEVSEHHEDKAYDYGAMDVIYKPFSPRVVMRRTKNLIDLFASRANLEAELRLQQEEALQNKEKLMRNNDFLINTLSTVSEFRSLESSEHVHHLKIFARMLLNYLAKFFPEYGLTSEHINLIVRAAALHDIGKIAIPDSILLKPGKLTEEEFTEMKRHTTYGCDILENYKQEDDDFYRYCYEICRWHHERYDGNGYPDHLKGDEIPIWAQVVALADVYDSLVSERCYKTAYDVRMAAEMIETGQCGIFSPHILECFENLKEDFFDVAEAMSGI